MIFVKKSIRQQTMAVAYVDILDDRADAMYNELDDMMGRAGGRRQFIADDGKTYRLPGGWYLYFGNADTEQYFSAAKSCAQQVHPEAAVIMMEVTTMYLHGLARPIDGAG